MTLRTLVASLFLIAAVTPEAIAAKVPLPPERPAGLNGDAAPSAPAIAETPSAPGEDAVLPSRRPAGLATDMSATDGSPAADAATEAATAPPEADAPADPADSQLVGAPPPQVLPDTAAATRAVPLPPEKPGEMAARVAMAMPRAPAGGGERMVCADPRLVGRQKPAVVGHIPGCVIGAPVEVLRIAGIRLSTPATLDCHTARTFANWVTGVADTSARKILGGRIARIWVMGSYSCRTRNNRRGARLSEHAAGRAVDIGGFTLGDGRKIRVEEHWGKGDSGKFLRGIWKQACGSFTTVLGPDGDRFHRDHLHLDTAPRRSSYCR